jgi:hypothetical protein
MSQVSYETSALFRPAPMNIFIVHFPGVPDKHAAIDEFSSRYDLQNETLLKV